VIIKDIKFIGEKKNHLSLILENNNKSLKGLVFNFDKTLSSLYLGQKIDLIYKIKKNEYKGNLSIDLNLIDIKIK